MRVSWSELHTQADQGFDPVGPEQAEVPSDDGAPVMGHHEHLLLIRCDGVQDCHEVSNHVEAGVAEREAGASVSPYPGKSGATTL
ncbi:hypothetical protein ACFX2H_023131 [Malus domestica]